MLSDFSDNHSVLPRFHFISSAHHYFSIDFVIQFLKLVV